MIASVGCSIVGSGTSSTRTSRMPCQVSAFMRGSSGVVVSVVPCPGGSVPIALDRVIGQDAGMRRIGDFRLTWGESRRWDEQRQRLYFVDCLENRLHWLDGGEPPLHTVELPSLPAGVVLTDRGGLV